MHQFQSNLFVWRKIGYIHKVKYIIFLDQVVIVLIGEGEAQHSLFFKIGLVDTCKRLYQDYRHAQMSWLHGRMLPGGAFPIVVVSHYHRLDPGGLIGSLCVWYPNIFPCELVLNKIGLLIECVYGTDEGIVGNIVQMAPKSQPGSGHRDMIGSTFTKGLDQ